MLEDSALASAPYLFRLSGRAWMSKALAVSVSLQKLCLAWLLQAPPVLYVMIFNPVESSVLFIFCSWYLLCTTSPGTSCTTA